MMLDGDQYQQIRAHGNPDLRLHGVDRIAEEVLDRQILLEPLEEQLDLPAVLVDVGNRESWHIEQVGQEHQSLAGFRVAKRHSAQMFRIARLRLGCRQQNRLVGSQSCGSIDLAGSNPGGTQIVFGADDEADLLPVQCKQSCEIQITPIDHENRTCRQADRVEQAHIVNLAGRDADEHGDGATQIHDHMSFDSRFGLPEMRPWKQRQAQIDGRRIHCEDRPLQSQANILVPIQGQGDHDQALTECFEQAIVSPFGGIGQGRAGNRAANANVIELRASSIEAGNQIAQPGTACQLRVGQADEMTPGRERRDTFVRLIHIDQMLEVAERNEFQQLRKDRPAVVHDPASPARKAGDDTAHRPFAISNRRNRPSAGTACQERLCSC